MTNYSEDNDAPVYIPSPEEQAEYRKRQSMVYDVLLGQARYTTGEEIIERDRQILMRGKWVDIQKD